MASPFGKLSDAMTDFDAGVFSRALMKVAGTLHSQARSRIRAGQKGPGLKAKRKLRIAIGRIAQETNALSPVPSTMADFSSVHLLEGQALLDACVWTNAEAEGFAKNAELSGFVDGVRAAAFARDADVEFVPLVSAWAVPAGPLTRACFDELVGSLVDKLRAAGAVDGILLSLHGAMGVHDLPLPVEESPESEIMRRVREVAPQVPMGITLYLHGNIVPGLVERAEIIQAYRTNPHRDHAAVGQKVGALMVRTLHGEIKPTTQWRSLPMLVGGAPAIDFWPPLRGIFRRMDEMEKNEDVLAVSVLTVHPWNWHQELGWSTLVVTDDDAALADACADELAEMCWDVRHHQPPLFASPEQAIADARKAKWARRTGVCVFSDASDVVSAGAPGDSTNFVRALVDQAQGMRTYCTVRDPDLVVSLTNNHKVGDHVRVTLGGKFDAARNPALELEADIHSLSRAHGIGRMVVLRVGTVFILLCEGPALAIRPAFYENAGLKVRSADIVVVKNFFPFLLFFAPYARMIRFVRTGGVTDFDAAYVLSFKGAMHPRDPVDDWREADRRRRKHAA